MPGRACESVVASRCLCGSCERALQASDLHEDEFVQRYRPSPAHRHLTGESCVVHRDGVRCERRQESNQTGLCHAHTSRWNRTRDRLGLSREEWCAGVARPLPPRPACTVAGCPADARVDVGLCGGHFRVWRLGQAALGIERREEAEAWAARQPQRLRANEFSLAAAGADGPRRGVVRAGNSATHRGSGSIPSPAVASCGRSPAWTRWRRPRSASGASASAAQGSPTPTAAWRGGSST